MGVAAYQRGSALISRQIDDEYGRDSIQHILDRLDSQEPGRIRMLSERGVIRVDEHGNCWLMNRKDRGWAEFGLCFSSLDRIRRKYAILIHGFGRDQFSPFWTWTSIPHLFPRLS